MRLQGSRGRFSLGNVIVVPGLETPHGDADQAHGSMILKLFRQFGATGRGSRLSSAVLLGPREQSLLLGGCAGWERQRVDVRRGDS